MPWSTTGHDVHLLIPAEAPDIPWEALARQYGVNHPFRIQRLTSRRVLRRLDFVWYAHAAARRLEADLVYTWLPQSAALESWLRTPVVLEMHADVAGVFGAWWLRQFWAGSGRRRLLVTTEALRKALERSTRIEFPDASVQVAPNGVDLERYVDLPQPAEARKQLHLADAITVGFTGHFYPGRGIDLLFELAQDASECAIPVGGRNARGRGALAPEVGCRAPDERDADGLRGEQPSAALSGGGRHSGDAVWPASGGKQWTGYLGSDQPDEDVRVHGCGPRHHHGRSAGDSRSAG